jgi:hypothetical protein
MRMYQLLQPLFCLPVNFLVVLSINIITNNSVALVPERTIPTELPPLVGEVSDDFCG